MKPAWLKCDKCLWFATHSELYPEFVITDPINPDEKQPDYCMFEGFGSYTKPLWFCSHWTCANCWQTWDKLVLENFNYYSDHFKCEKVEFK